MDPEAIDERLHVQPKKRPSVEKHAHMYRLYRRCKQAEVLGCVTCLLLVVRNNDSGAARRKARRVIVS